MKPLVRTSNLKCVSGFSTILDNISVEVQPGKVVGLIGPNGSGKTTLLRSIVGLHRSVGDLELLGHDPRLLGQSLFRDVFFIPDSGALPRWIRIKDLFKFISGINQCFDYMHAMSLLSETGIDSRANIGKLSKGMVAQLYVLIATAVNAKLLILDEPTLGLDLLFRKNLYTSLLHSFIDSDRSVLISTHEIIEIEDVLTDIIFLNEGKILMASSMRALSEKFFELNVKSDYLTEAKAIPHVSSRACPGGRKILYKDVSFEKLQGLGQIKTPALSDIFIALAGT